MDLEVSHYELTRKYHHIESTDVNRSPAKEEYKKELAHTLMQTSGSSTKVLAFGARVPQQQMDHENALRNHFTHNREASKLPRKYTRHIPQDAERILDAPDLINDFYLNLLDWSSNNSLGVALGDSIYLWNANNGSIQTLMKTQGDNSHVTSLAWIQQGNYMAVGTSDHEVQIWDVDKCRQIRSMCGHTARVGALSWNGPVLSSGSRDASIIQHDVRIADHKVGRLNGHTQEVCGLRWSPAGTLLASGGNDNLLNLWDDRYQTRIVPIVKGGSIDAPLHRLNAHKVPLSHHLSRSGCCLYTLSKHPPSAHPLPTLPSPLPLPSLYLQSALPLPSLYPQSTLPLTHHQDRMTHPIPCCNSDFAPTTSAPTTTNPPPPHSPPPTPPPPHPPTRSWLCPYTGCSQSARLVPLAKVAARLRRWNSRLHDPVLE